MSEPSTFKFLSEEYLTAGDLSLSKTNYYTLINGHLNVSGGSSVSGLFTCVDVDVLNSISISASASLFVNGDAILNKKFSHFGLHGVTLDSDTKEAWQTALSIPENTDNSLLGKANKAGDTFSGQVTFDALVEFRAAFSHYYDSVYLQYPSSWRDALQVGIAKPELPVQSTSPIYLTNANTMSRVVVDMSLVSPGNISLGNLSSGIATGMVWEICQMGTGTGTLIATTPLAGQVVTMRFPPGGGPKTAGQYSTMFVRVLAASGTGASAVATVLVTGGVP